MRVGAARDVIVVVPSSPESKHNNVACSDFFIKITSSYWKGKKGGSTLTVRINKQTTVNGFNLLVCKDGLCRFPQPGIGNSLSKPRAEKLTELLNFLNPGQNKIEYCLSTSKFTIESNIYLWSSSDSILISDIDGTITKSDLKGIMDSLITETYKHVHRGVCSFYSSILSTDIDTNTNDPEMKNKKSSQQAKIQIIYLTSRPMSLLPQTRKLLSFTTQDGSRLPPGPILCHPGSLAKVLYTELIEKNAHKFKGNMLLEQVVNPFSFAGRPNNTHLFIAGFGNKITDALAYEMAGACRKDIYIIDESSNIVCLGIQHEQTDDISLVQSKPKGRKCEKVTNANETSKPGILNSSFVHLTDCHVDVCHVCVGDSFDTMVRPNSNKNPESGRELHPNISTSQLFNISTENSWFDSYDDPDLIVDIKRKLKAKLFVPQC